jgi:excisionase family DNA binding protein
MRAKVRCQAERCASEHRGAEGGLGSDRLNPIDLVAKRLGVSSFTVRRQIRAKQLRAVRIGKRVLVAESEIERIIREGCGQHAGAR